MNLKKLNGVISILGARLWLKCQKFRRDHTKNKFVKWRHFFERWISAFCYEISSSEMKVSDFSNIGVFFHKIKWYCEFGHLTICQYQCQIDW